MKSTNPYHGGRRPIASAIAAPPTNQYPEVLVWSMINNTVARNYQILSLTISILFTLIAYLALDFWPWAAAAEIL